MSRGYKDLNTHSRRMFSTWRGDCNHDHEAVGRAAAEAAGIAPMLPPVILERMRLPYEIVFV